MHSDYESRSITNFPPGSVSVFKQNSELAFEICIFKIQLPMGHFYVPGILKRNLGCFLLLWAVIKLSKLLDAQEGLLQAHSFSAGFSEAGSASSPCFSVTWFVRLGERRMAVLCVGTF